MDNEYEFDELSVEHEFDELSVKINEIKSICQECDSTNKIGVDLDLMSVIDICNEIK